MNKHKEKHKHKEKQHKEKQHKEKQHQEKQHKEKHKHKKPCEGDKLKMPKKMKYTHCLRYVLLKYSKKLSLLLDGKMVRL